MDDDREIIIRVLAGDRNAFEGIILKYEQQVFRWLSRMIPRPSLQEAAQEVFVRAFQDLGSYRGEAPFSHWLAKLARHAAYDHWRKIRRDRLLPLTPEELEMFSAERAKFPDPASSLETRELLERVFVLLKPDERLVFMLYYVDERTVREISSELGLSIANVKIRLYRARKRIQRLLRG